MTGGESINENAGEINTWVSSLTRLLEDVPQHMCSPGHPGRISRIPQNLREVDLKAYEPYFLSIGPYHNGQPKFQNMEKRKQMVLKCVLENMPELTIKDYLKEIKSIESVARSFYTDVEMENDKFVQMLLLDSVYILTMFCGMASSQERLNHTSKIDTIETEKHIDEIMQNKYDNENEMKMMLTVEELNVEAGSTEDNDNPSRWFWSLFVHDIFLLENQLPFFVLQKIYDFAYGGSKGKLIDILKVEVVNWLSNYTKLEADVAVSSTEEVYHLLHLCHKFFRPKVQQDAGPFQLPECNQMFRLGSAMQLYEAGVRFEARSPTTHHSLLDITVGSHGNMVMPCLYVDENIDSLLRNLVALEQMKYPHLGLDVSAYVVLLLHLITTPEDVELLRRKGVIHHHLPSDKEMMLFINKLSVGLSFDYIEDKHCLKPVFHELKRYTERRIPRWRAWLKHRHFRNPWTVISLMVAALLLILTVLQTFYTVYSYYHPYFGNHS